MAKEHGDASVTPLLATVRSIGQRTLPASKQGAGMQRRRIVGLAMMAGMAWSTGAMAAELTPAYLDGRWTTGVVENCTRPEHEQTVFRANGTFATEHNGKALAVGFWRIEDARIDMQILTTEASLPQNLLAWTQG